MRRARWALLAAAWALAACGDALRPEDVTAAGFWRVGFALAPSDFQLDLVEAPDGTLGGTWSFPSLFAYHEIRGRRDGLDVELTGDSPNLYPVTFSLRFVRRDRMEGYFYFGGTTERVVLAREPNGSL